MNIIYTDGACKKNPGGPGGCSAIILKDGVIIDTLRYAEWSTTNNRMELMGLIIAEKHLKEAIVYSDSRYLVDGTMSWMKKWKAKGWKKKSLKNKDLWLRIYDLKQKYNFTMKWVKGHAGNALNELADQEADAAMRSVTSKDVPMFKQETETIIAQELFKFQ